MRRLVAQTLEDDSSVTSAERAGLQQVQSIRAFDDLITAPRWGYGGVERYYQQASPARLDQLRTPRCCCRPMTIRGCPLQKPKGSRDVTAPWRW